MSTNNASLAMQRIAKLVDENSFMEIGSLVTARSTDFNLTAAKTPSDGVITGHGLVNGSLVFVYSQDASVLNGTIGEMHAKKIVNVYNMAMKMGAPVIGLVDCGGIRLQESVDALESFGQIYAAQVAASGIVPQICGIFGNCGGGLSVVPALCDFAFIEESKGKMFINSPDAVKGNRADKCDMSKAAFQAEENGCIDMTGSEDEIIAGMRELISMLPLNNESDVYTDECEDDLNRVCENLSAMKGDPRFVLSEMLNIFLESANFENALHHAIKVMKLKPTLDGLIEIRNQWVRDTFSGPPDCGTAYNYTGDNGLADMIREKSMEYDSNRLYLDESLTFLVRELEALATKEKSDK